MKGVGQRHRPELGGSGEDEKDAAQFAPEENGHHDIVVVLGAIVECQQARTQGENREKALKMLKSRLYEEELRKREELKNATNSTKKKIEWGSQIRSYVFHPYKMIKDHRTDYEVGNVQPVMDGELDGFIKAYLMSEKESKN